MSKVQDYIQGVINRLPSGKYQYVVKGDVRGTYSTIRELVASNPQKEKNGQKSSRDNSSSSSKQDGKIQESIPKTDWKKRLRTKRAKKIEESS